MNRYETVTLIQQIEHARQHLHDLYEEYGFGHACVLEQSMLLDELINHYNRMYQTRKQPHHVLDQNINNDDVMFSTSSPFSLCKTVASPT
ncbi:aspartyl-phosphate phosphatase Spo0E family protein [Paenibacillus sp. CH40]|uniref:aspartyl-phosphate phosphatase Spo0E family protein n=1 Tax=Paenibacillus sp. CH40 TaxID=2962045 RepID=UPI0020B63D22|nr:aspartyl-phosphate phosphatase Spo0E family protein [Paenibacillus sp. CH40]MCP3795794.1 aspartyl-phosphate phosphatase Spo0E family protein [Paenibacillus sp. CH40]